MDIKRVEELMKRVEESNGRHFGQVGEKLKVGGIWGRHISLSEVLDEIIRRL